MKLTANFSTVEFEHSDDAISKGIDNTIHDSGIAINLRALAENILQPVRDHFRKRVRINSGYRCAALNKAQGSSSKTSQHMRGEAADIEIMGLSNHVLAEWIRDNLPFDQLILENHQTGDPNSGWVHVSYCRDRQRKMVLTATFKGGKAKYTPGLIV